MRQSVRILLVVPLALIAAVAGAALLGGCGLQDEATESTSGTIHVAKDATAKAEIMMIKTGIQAYITANAALPPDATQATLGGLVSPWPTNPFSKAAMKPGSEPGEYVYTSGPGLDYSLTVNLSDGSTYTAP